MIHDRQCTQRKGGTLQNKILFVTVRVGYTELIMRYHPKGTGYEKSQKHAFHT